MPANFTIQADALYSNFTWPATSDNNFLLGEVMTGISTGIAVVSTLTGDDVVAAAGALIGGLITEGMAAAQSDADAANDLSV